MGMIKTGHAVTKFTQYIACQPIGTFYNRPNCSHDGCVLSAN